MRFQPVASPGAGALVALGGGYVYQRSTIQDLSGPFPFSDGPTTPTVLLASTRGSQLIVQGFTAANTPSVPDTYVEPLGDRWALALFRCSRRTIRPPPAIGGRIVDRLDTIRPGGLSTAAHVQLALQYQPVGAPASTFAGLYDIASLDDQPECVGAQCRAERCTDSAVDQCRLWLQQRLLAAYASAIGVDYQHHHVANWLPEQGSVWNLTSTVAYQSEGLDCTDLTSYAYADALGITMNSGTPSRR